MYPGYASTANQNGTTAPSNGRLTEVESYMVFDAMASYKISKNLSTQINIYNLADKEYVANVNKNGNRYTPGAARSGLLSLAYKF